LVHIDWSYCHFNHYSWCYLYDFNYIFPPVFNKIPLNVYLYLLILWAMFMSASLWFIIQGNLKGPRFSSWMVWCASGGLIMILFFQLFGQQQHWAKEMREIVFKDDIPGIKDKTEEIKFSDFVISHASSNFTCNIVSKENVRYIIYALYPKVLVANKKDSNCVLVYKMKEPLKYVPGGFDKISWYDDQSLIVLREEDR